MSERLRRLDERLLPVPATLKAEDPYGPRAWIARTWPVALTLAVLGGVVAILLTFEAIFVDPTFLRWTQATLMLLVAFWLGSRAVVGHREAHRR
jgi:hypothetical protein